MFLVMKMKDAFWSFAYLRRIRERGSGTLAQTPEATRCGHQGGPSPATAATAAKDYLGLP